MMTCRESFYLIWGGVVVVVVWWSIACFGCGAGQACWGVPAADQPPCADHVCKKGVVQGGLWVEG